MAKYIIFIIISAYILVILIFCQKARLNRVLQGPLAISANAKFSACAAHILSSFFVASQRRLTHPCRWTQLVIKLSGSEQYRALTVVDMYLCGKSAFRAPKWSAL